MLQISWDLHQTHFFVEVATKVRTKKEEALIRKEVTSQLELEFQCALQLSVQNISPNISDFTPL